jgi:hypothetical protein
MTRRGVLIVACVVSACGSSPPPKPAAPPPTKKVPALEADVGGKHLTVRFADALVHGDAHAPARIVSIDVDGNTLYPRDCAAKSKTPLLACSKAHRAIDKAVDFHLVSSHVTESAVELLIAGRAGNSIECGAYDYWVLHVDKNRSFATEPASGCFTMPSLDEDAMNPVVEWGAAQLTVKTFDEKSTPCALSIPTGGMVWKITKSKKP